MNFSNITTPGNYSNGAFLAQEAGRGLLSRLDLMKLNPRHILDMGCGAGLDIISLKEKFPQSLVSGIDLAREFLQAGKKYGAMIQADASILPLRSGVVDVAFSNMLLPWCKNPLVFLSEWRRVLRPGGLVIFSCLGPDTFKEIVGGELLPSLVDMHDVGDALLSQGFIDPVLEVEEITLTYRSLEQMEQELQHSGMLVGALESSQKLEVTFEIVYAHAWCPINKGFKPDASGEVKIPISQLKNRGRA